MPFRSAPITFKEKPYTGFSLKGLLSLNAFGYTIMGYGLTEFIPELPQLIQNIGKHPKNFNTTQRQSEISPPYRPEGKGGDI